MIPADRRAQALLPAAERLAIIARDCSVRRMSLESDTPTQIDAVDRELLSGRTADTNSAWIAARLRPLGARVTRIAVVDDEPAEIARRK